MRLYVSSRSYPEFREVPMGFLQRGGVWLRAFVSSVRDLRLVLMLALHVALVLAGLAGAAAVVRIMSTMPSPPLGVVLFVTPMVLIVLQLPAMLLAVSGVGDALRPHLRAVHPACRGACPSCGYGLADRFEAAEAAGESVVRCPECGAEVPLSVWTAPYPIPPRFRALPWP